MQAFLLCGIDVTIGEPVAIGGGAVYIYIPEVSPVGAWLNGVCVGGGGNPYESRGGNGGPTGRLLPSPNGGKQSPAAAALRKSIFVRQRLSNVLHLQMCHNVSAHNFT